jgi:hypothetical protein
MPGRLKQWPASAHRGEGPRQIDRQHKVEEIIVEGAQIGMQDNPGGVRIVDQDVETALGGIDLGGEAFDRTRILRRRTAGAVAGAGHLRSTARPPRRHH